MYDILELYNAFNNFDEAKYSTKTIITVLKLFYCLVRNFMHLSCCPIKLLDVDKLY